MSKASERASANIRRVMGARRIPQKLLAAALDVDQAGVSARLRGVTAWRLDEVEAAAAFLGLTLQDVLSQEPLMVEDIQGTQIHLALTAEAQN